MVGNDRSPRTTPRATARHEATMSTAREPILDRSRRTPTGGAALRMTADATRGTSNLATRPRAGNISTETRAGA